MTNLRTLDKWNIQYNSLVYTLGALVAYSLNKPTINVGTTVDRQLTLS